MLALEESIDSEPAGSSESPVEKPPPEPGTLVGGCYRILDRLGAGAMGIVLLAHDQTLDRRVAIKWTRSHFLSAGFRESFVSEARAMARVSHPNVVQIHSYGEHEGTPYFVMECVDGPTLEQWLDRNKRACDVRRPDRREGADANTDVDLAVRILDEVCDGVSAIHGANTVHRDIKPSNILLDERLRPRVADLGLSVLSQQDEPAERQMAGTPAYMAPEIAFGKRSHPELRVRADVYSVGCVAYELLTGRLPFDGAGLLIQHAMRPVVPPSRVREALGPQFDELIVRALAKDPAERTPSVDALRRELLAAHQGEREPVRILVAEDDDDFRGALGLYLAHFFPGAEIECVRSGLEAVQAVDRKVPSVALLDLRMPGMDGIELTERLRARSSSADMPIIVVTASGGSDEWRRLAALGADRFLVKPVVLDDLVALVRRVLRERARQRPPLRA
jgi:serine/threonine-protein kinase